ncbi:unnamed protein product, partial [Polarella glacialis]
MPPSAHGARLSQSITIRPWWASSPTDPPGRCGRRKETFQQGHGVTDLGLRRVAHGAVAALAPFRPRAVACLVEVRLEGLEGKLRWQTTHPDLERIVGLFGRGLALALALAF